MVEQLYNWSGHYFGYRDKDELWTYDGRHVGRFEAYDIYGPEGRYIGEVRNGSYLIRDAHKRSNVKGHFTPKEKRPETVRHVDRLGFSLPYGFEEFPKL